MVLRHLRVPEVFSRGPCNQNYFHNNTKPLFALSAVLTFTSMVQEQLWVKFLVPQTEIEAAAGDYISSYYILHHHALTVKIKNRKQEIFPGK